ncbi:MAG: zf-HC2 domain-containing protein [Oscillospiraceae bacterium]|nr:zf-HC2 domain-containing protein [Oscillospiraceae bacterium]
MYEISCDMCMDLIPLVKDGVASQDSMAAVEGHIAGCDRCRALFDDAPLPEGDEMAGMNRAIKRVKTVSTICLWVLLLAGILLCELVMQGSSLFFLMVAGSIWWLGWHALRKDAGVIKRLVSIVMMVLLVAFTLWTFNEIYGNPITKNTAKEAVQEYLEAVYPGKDLYIESVSHNMSAGSYEADIAGKDGGFYVSWRDGKILYDTFGES